MKYSILFVTIKCTILCASLVACGARDGSTAKSDRHSPPSESPTSVGFLSSEHVLRISQIKHYQIKDTLHFKAQMSVDWLTHEPRYDRRVEGNRLAVESVYWLTDGPSNHAFSMHVESTPETFLYVPGKKVLSTLRYTDKIFLYDQGRIYEVGSFVANNESRNPYTDNLYPRLCEGEYNQICELVVTARANFSQLVPLWIKMEDMGDPSKAIKVPAVEFDYKCKRLIKPRLNVNIQPV